MKKMKVAVVGVGHLGKEHARIYSELENVELVCVVDVDIARAKEIAKLYGCEAYSKVKSIIGKVDAASVAVPTDGHYKVSRKLIASGIHLLIEKPITSTVIQAKRLVKYAQENKVILQVGHVERFNPIIQKLTKLLVNPRFIEIHRLSPFTPRGTEVGVVLDLMIHDIDIVLGLVKDDIKRIDAIGVGVLTSREDIANARITFKNGCVANVTASRISAERMRKIRVFQHDSYLSLDYYKKHGVCFSKQGQNITKQELTAESEEPLKLELQSFIDALIKGYKPLVDGTDALKALEVADKIVKLIWK